MPSPSSIRDNRPIRGTVGDFLKSGIQPGSDLSFVSAYFTVHAYAALAEQLEQSAGLRFLFGEPSFIAGIGHDDKQKANFRLTDTGLELAKTLTQSAAAKACADWIERLVEIRSIRQSNFLHGKTYHIENGNASSAILGSSNFTVPGLGLGANSNIELNLVVDSDRDRHDLKAWFDEVWHDESLTKDVKEDVLTHLRRLAEPNSPQFLYFLTLFHLFRHELDGTRDVDDALRRTTLFDSQIWKMLYSFQRDGVKGAINKLLDYNGCILADSVGLGKTFEALAVIRYFELRNERALVLCPKKLRQNWTVYRGNSRLNPLSDDRFGYDVLSHTDLSRTSGYTGDIDLSHFQWENYSLLVIDESHNFRNNAVGTATHDGRQRRTRYERLLEDVIQSGQKTKVLLLSATPVNNQLADLRNQISFIAGGDVAREEDPAYDGAFRKSLGIPSVRETTKRAQAKFTNWTKKPVAERKARDLIHELGSDFFKLLDGLSIARSRAQIKRYYAQEMEKLGGFPLRKKPVAEYPAIDLHDRFLSFEELDKRIDELTLSLYHPSSHLLADLPTEVKARYEAKIGNFNQKGRERILIAMMKVNFLKRLESSIDSFRLTLQRTIDKIEHLEAKIAAFEKVRDAIPELDFADLMEADFDDLDLDPEDLQIGGRHKISLAHLNLPDWLMAVRKDRVQLQNLLDHARPVSAGRDAKLARVRELIAAKCAEPSLNRDGKPVRKILLFTAFADTARYLHNNLRDWCVEAATRPLLHSCQGQAGPDTSVNLFIPFSLRADVRRTRQHLPHWHQDGCTYFVTYRLADSLPMEKLAKWKEEIETWRSLHPEPWTESEWREYEEFFARKEEWLDAGHGECLLRDPPARSIVEENLRHFDGERYILDEFVVMPNHVHVLVKPLSGHSLAEILHSWKSYTANKINGLFGRTGTLWLEESFDHIVRNWERLEHYRDYIRRNPRKGVLKSGRGCQPLVAASPFPPSSAQGQAGPATQLHLALVAGGGEYKTSLGKADLDHILTNFSPISKQRDRQPELPQHQEIDLLIATDCISEGQNLQDCDFLINYDIHWNPVRIIQRFGRIDRIGSRNSSVSLVNFWPTKDLDAYLNVKNRVEDRMALVDLTASGEDNLLASDQIEDLITADLHYRNRQLKRLQEEILDLEELDEEMISLADFSLTDFRLDLLRYLETNRELLESAELGLFAVVPPDPQLPVSQPGILFCLRKVAGAARPGFSGNQGQAAPATSNQVNPLAPYYLVYVLDDGNVRLTFMQPKQCLELFRTLAAGHASAFAKLCDAFDARNQNGADMSHEMRLLDAAIESIKRTFARRAGVALLSGRDGMLPRSDETPSSANDMEMVTWLVIMESD